MDLGMLRKMTLLITTISLPFILGFCWATYAISHNTEFNIDVNIILTHEQQLFVMQVLLSSLTGLSILSCIAFAVIFNNDKIRSIWKGLINPVVLFLLISTVVLIYKYFPPGLQSFVV